MIQRIVSPLWQFRQSIFFDVIVLLYKIVRCDGCYKVVRCFVCDVVFVFSVFLYSREVV